MYTKEDILALLYEEASALKENTRKYLDSLSLNSGQEFTFTANEEERKRLLGKYNLFSSLLARSVDGFEKHIAILSGMICESDQSCDNDSTLFLSSILEAYFTLCASFSLFIITNEENFTQKNSPFTVRCVFDQAICLENAVDAFIKKISE